MRRERGSCASCAAALPHSSFCCCFSTCARVSAVRNGHIKRITDPDIQSSVLEIAGTNVSTTYVTCPADPKQTLGIKLPFLVMIIKNVRHSIAVLDAVCCLAGVFVCVATVVFPFFIPLLGFYSRALLWWTGRVASPHGFPCLLLLSFPAVAVEEVLHVRGDGAGRQERAPAVPRIQLPGPSRKPACCPHVWESLLLLPL